MTYRNVPSVSARYESDLGIKEKLRVLIDVFRLYLVAITAFGLAKLRHKPLIALSISKREKLVLRAENSEQQFLLSARLHKVNGRSVILKRTHAKLINCLFASAVRVGCQVYIKGCADRDWGLSLPDHPNVKRIEISIWGPNALSSNSGLFSYVSDAKGIYYDGRTQTELEEMLNALSPNFWRNDEFTKRFVMKQKEVGIQKYPEVDGVFELDPEEEAVLITGQVSGDASTVHTLTLAKSNYELAQLARKMFPEQPLYYKPHPYERGKDETRKILKDFKVSLVPAAASFEQAAKRFRSVFVNTSGAGLEAAMLGCTVYTAGVSFFSHWGFTKDCFKPVERRHNKLSPEDVYGAFICCYAKYVKFDEKSKKVTLIPFAEFLDLHERKIVLN
ncbi:hypothetical protein [Cohaesibacter intestini]|uniref:capsular polysaccharide export protein, LipB/KpsS family n=1 Tax=Cohaesibacter intestini TaxID=2211145 RepID=UPI000DEBD3A6|nr:hypothetical protein [Cohaesibacter intestini]